MINFPAGYVDSHGVDLTNAVGYVTDVNFSKSCSGFSTRVNGVYDHRENADVCSVHFRVVVFVDAQAETDGKAALPFKLNGSDYFHLPEANPMATPDERIAACEAYILSLI